MTTNKRVGPMTEQQTRGVYITPRYVDMFTGDLSTRPPKRGPSNEAHVRLHDSEDKARVVPGMAHLAGSGPEGKYCRDCDFFADRLEVRRPDGDGTVLNGVKCCAKAAALTGYPQRGAIANCDACRHFIALVESRLKRDWHLWEDGRLVYGLFERGKGGVVLPDRD